MKQQKTQQYISEQHTCPICINAFYKPVKLKKCKHVFCSTCIDQSCLITGNNKCPLCRQPIQNNQMQPITELWNQMQALYPQTLNAKKKFITQRVLVRYLLGNSTKKIQAQPGSNNSYEWTLFMKPVQGGQPLSKTIRKVQIELHPTFQKSKLYFTLKDNQQINVTRIGWGTFEIKLKVFWKEDKFIQKQTLLTHYLSFDPLQQKVVNAYLTLKP